MSGERGLMVANARARATARVSRGAGTARTDTACRLPDPSTGGVDCRSASASAHGRSERGDRGTTITTSTIIICIIIVIITTILIRGPLGKRRHARPLSKRFGSKAANAQSSAAAAQAWQREPQCLEILRLHRLESKPADCTPTRASLPQRTVYPRGGKPDI